MRINQRYQHRAECQDDILYFHRHITDYVRTLNDDGQKASDGGHHYAQIFEMTPFIDRGGPLRDTSVVFETTLLLDDLKHLASDLDDCHVIEESLNTVEKYTGGENIRNISRN